MNIFKSAFLKISFVIVSCYIFVACSNPLDKRYSKHTSEDDFRRIRELNKLDSADASLLAHYMVDHGLIGNHVIEDHETYRQILEKAKKDKEKHDKEMLKARKEGDFAKIHENEKLKNLNKALKVILIVDSLNEESAFAKPLKKGVPSVVNKNILNYKIAFQNMGDKSIKAFKGEVAFYDLFLAEVNKVTISNFNEIAPGDSIFQTFKVNLDETSNAKNINLGLKKEYLKIEWHPERLIYTDGEIIE